MLVGVCGAKGSSGVTTAAFGLARLFSESSPTLFAEADPQGGIASVRLGLSSEPGLSTLAASGRHGISQPVVDENVQRASERLSLLLAPRSPHRARSVLATIGAQLASALSRFDLVVADLGRLECDSPALPIAHGADAVVFVTPASLEGADALRVRLEEMPELHHKALLAPCSEGPYRASEIAEVLRIPLASHLQDQSRTADLVWSGAALKTKTLGPLLKLASAVEKRTLKGRAFDGSDQMQRSHSESFRPTEHQRR